jgi:hypothetical protein
MLRCGRAMRPLPVGWTKESPIVSFGFKQNRHRATMQPNAKLDFGE